MKRIFLCNPCRTAVGKFGGALSAKPAAELGAVVVSSCVGRAGIAPYQIDDCILGNVLQAGQGMNPARQAAIYGGLPSSVPAMTVNRVCGSGLQAVLLAHEAVANKRAALVVAGGMENMDQAPFYLKKARYGYRLCLPKDELIDGMVFDGLWDVFNDYHMGITAENIASRYGISREAQDEFALESHQKALAAIDAGVFQGQITPVSIKGRKGDETIFDRDEQPRADTSLERLSLLKPAFKKDGTVTAGNASSINSGAAAVLVAREEVATRESMDVFGFLSAYAVTAVEPEIMGMGPVSAMKQALEQARLQVGDIDLFELNEAFAAQALGVLQELPLPREKLNVNGGAIALGHPIGATGAVLLVKLLHELRRRGERRGMVSLCIGGGMGIAAIVERV